MDNTSQVQPSDSAPTTGMPTSPYGEANDWMSQPEAPLPPKRRSHRTLVVALVTCSLLLGVVGLVFWLNRSPTCLSDEDYRALTGDERTDPLSSRTSFSTQIIYFVPDSTDYDYTDMVEGDALLNIGEFYASHREKSIMITLDGNYYSDSQLELTQRRIATVQASLVNAGVDANVITITEPTLLPLDEPDENGDNPNSPIMVTITSADTCN